MKHCVTLSGLVLGVSLAGGCATARPVDQGAKPSDTSLSHGYALLYQVCSKQRKAKDLFFIKPAAKQTKAIVEAVSADSGAMADAIKARHDAGLIGAIDPKGTGIPMVEHQARMVIQDQTTKAILFGSNTEKRMILAQLDATRYCAALAQTLAANDKAADAAWRGELTSFQDKMHKAYDQLYDRLMLVPENLEQ